MNAHSGLLPELEVEKTRCIRETRMGVGMPIAGMLWWLVYAFLVSHYRIDSAV